MIQTIDSADVGNEDTILDVRRHVGSAQIRGARRHEPKHLLEAAHLTLPLNVEGTIVLFADSEKEADEIGGRITATGAQDVRFLSGGIEGWRKSRPTKGRADARAADSGSPLGRTSRPLQNS
jgi:hypothetical protein